MPASCRNPAAAPRPDPLTKLASSRITNGSQLLPSIDGRSIWARLMRDVLASMVAHCGGAQHITEPMRLMARRVACLECELIHMEDSFAQLRQAGHAPKSDALDLYARMAGHQRRILEALGLNPVARDVTPDALSYARQFDGDHP